MNTTRRRLQKRRANQRKCTFTVRVGDAVHTIVRVQFPNASMLRFYSDVGEFSDSVTMHLNSAGIVTSSIPSWSGEQFADQYAHDEMRKAEAIGLKKAIGRGWYPAEF